MKRHYKQVVTRGPSLRRGCAAHPVVLHLVDGPVDKAPLRGGRVVGVQQDVVPRPAVAHQQPIQLHNNGSTAVHKLTMQLVDPQLLGNCGQ